MRGGSVYGGIQRKDAKVQRSEAKEREEEMKCPPHGSGERV